MKSVYPNELQNTTTKTRRDLLHNHKLWLASASIPAFCSQPTDDGHELPSSCGSAGPLRDNSEAASTQAALRSSDSPLVAPKCQTRRIDTNSTSRARARFHSISLSVRPAQASSAARAALCSSAAGPDR